LVRQPAGLWDANYYVQQLFSRNRGDVVLPVELQVRDASQAKGRRHRVGTWATQAEFKDLKVVCDGQTLFSCDFAQGTTAGNCGRRRLENEEGVLRQNSAAGLAGICGRQVLD